jgi:diguanylate cyclase (GGDEF)-like protein
MQDIEIKQSDIDPLTGFSDIDPLTGFYSREGLLRSAEKEVKKVDGLSKPVTIIYLNLHDYAKFVKEHGQAEGNSLLSSVGEFIRKSFKKFPLIGRLHVDEFVILLYGVDPARTISYLKRLRRRLDRELRKSNFKIYPCLGAISYLTTLLPCKKRLRTWRKLFII